MQQNTLAFPQTDKQVNQFAARKTMRKLWLLCLFPPLIPIVLILQLFYSLTLAKRCVGLFVLAILIMASGSCTVFLATRTAGLQAKLNTISFQEEGEVLAGADFYKKTQELYLKICEKKTFFDQEYAYTDELIQEIQALDKWNNQIGKEYYDAYLARLSEHARNGLIEEDERSFFFAYYYQSERWPTMNNGEYFSGDGQIEGEYSLRFLRLEYYVSTTEFSFWKGYDYASAFLQDLMSVKEHLKEACDTTKETIDMLGNYLREEPSSFPNGEIPDLDTAQAAFRAKREAFVQTTKDFDSTQNFMYICSTVSGQLFFLLLIGCVVFVCRGKELRDKVNPVAKEMDVLGGKPMVEQYMNALTAASRKKDAAAFYTQIQERHEQYLAAVPTLPFATQQDMRTGINEIVVRCAVTESASQAKALRKECKALWKKRDHAKLLEYKQLYAEKFEEYRLKVLENAKTEEFTPEYEGESRFDGNVLQKFGWDVLCFVVKWITLTIAKPATECWKQRWYTKHTVIDGKRLSFDGSGAQLFGKRSLNLFLTIITFGIYAIFSDFSMEKWAAKHTHVKGEYPQLGGTFDGNLAVWFFIRLGCFLLNVCTLFLLKPFTYCWKRGWYIRHCVYDGRRMVFDGNGAQLFGAYIKWFLLSIVTLGVYYLLWMSLNMKRWETEHTHLEEGYSCAL